MRRRISALSFAPADALLTSAVNRGIRQIVLFFVAVLSVNAARGERFALTGFLFLSGPFQLAAQNRELEALQAHFERVINTRSYVLFSGIRSVAQWHERKRQTRLALTRML